MATEPDIREIEDDDVFAPTTPTTEKKRTGREW